MSDKQQIQDWQEKIKQSFGDESRLYQYLFETMDNFYYRYLETTIGQNLKTTPLGPHTWGAENFESSMVQALKIRNPEAKKGIMELAKTIPKAEGPKVKYSLLVDVKELTPDHGVIKFIASINWDFPEFKAQEKDLRKSVPFKYEDLSQFRKELALRLEEACEIFL